MMKRIDDSVNVRSAWFEVLVCADRAALMEQSAPFVADMPVQWLRRPEAALVMVRARADAHGERFNLGEATVTRCALRWTDPAGAVFAGVAYLLGRDPERAERIARLDALLQHPAHHECLRIALLEPLKVLRAQHLAAERAAVAASRVRFDTVSPEV